MPAFVDRRLASIERAGRFRDPPTVEALHGVRGRVAGRDVRVFCSNDYLGLRQHPAVLAGAAAALQQGGGAGSSRLIAGSLPIHRELESELADWMGTEAALVLSSGYQANIAVLGALGRRADRIVSDELNHASIIDGCRLARADVIRVPHAAVDAVRAVLAEPIGGESFVVGEGLYSMDGDRGPVAGWASAGGHLVVDEAHAVGVLGPGGRGVCAESGIEPLVRVGTFGKAFGGHGAFVACDARTRELLVNTGRTYIFTTGLPPASAGAARAALAILRGDEGAERRAAVAARSRRLRAGLAEFGGAGGDPDSPIVPWTVGSAAAAVSCSAALLDAGFFATAIRPPTVPAGACRIRFTLSADHEDADVDALLMAIGRLAAAEMSR